jgi:hypothetical protein
MNGAHAFPPKFHAVLYPEGSGMARAALNGASKLRQLRNSSASPARGGSCGQLESISVQTINHE